MTARLLMLLCACMTVATAAPARAADREEVVVIRAGQVVTGTGETIENASIVIVDGEITAIGRSVEHPRTARIIDAQDQVVMPGLIHARTRFGLPNFDRGGQRADLKAADDVFLELIDFEELLRSGFTAVAFIPPGSGVPGRATVVRTAGPDDHRVLRDSAYIRVTMTSAGRDKATLRSALQGGKAAIEKEKAARAEWEKKKAEQEKAAADQKKPEQEPPKGAEGKAPSADEPAKPEAKPADAPAEFVPPPIEAALRPWVALINGQPGEIALIELNDAAGLLHTEDVIDDFDTVAVMFYLQPGAGDFNHVVARLGERKALVLTAPTMSRLPSTVVRYNLVAELFRAGAEVAVLPSGSTESMRTELAELVRSGLDADAALRSLTLNPARVVGVDDRLGTIEVGKHADLIFLDGPPLDGHSKVTRTMIRGETVWSEGD